MKAVHVLLAFLLGAQIGNTAAAELEVLGSEFHGTTTTSIVYADLQRQAYEALARRREAYEKLKTPDEIQAYQQRVREFFVGQLGGFPERTPLNAKVVGALQADGYRIEKIIFESQPNHRVTALLYLPDAKPPYPGVAVACGHSRTAKTADYNQRFAVAMALHGMAALCYDPIGQGERSQILTPEGKPRFNSTTQEHSIIGVGSILLGTNTARYRVWDGMRAIDYLASRPEINSKRIGVTGCSGGGTLSSYLMALDDRVLCAAPSCYLTTFQRLIETIGPQDAEQNIAGQVAFGMDHPDYILMRAPRPTLIGSTTGDYFDIQGAWDNFRQAKRLYWRLGFPERVDLVEGEGGHGVPPGNLVAITRWMRRWLLEKDDAVTLPEIPARTEAELLCLPEGQVLRLPNERSVFDLNIEWEKKLAEQRRELWARTPRAEAVRQVRDVLGVRRLDDLPRPKIEKMGTVQRENYSIEKLAIVPEGGVALPALAFVPAKPDNNAYLYLHGSGKQADAAPGGPIEKLVGQRHIVLAVDLRAIGETKAARVKEQQDDS
ncbi:acetylxylan esterase, partial [Candidatus Sumerlaeota bacterium]|nr:acetylxylan esterase [Candidatus Sumerlaeota bacterium]